jgi:hypothetical protein
MRRPAKTDASSTASNSGGERSPKPKRPKGQGRLPWSWQLSLLIALLGVGTVGTLGILSLVRLPQSGDCPRIFWPLASASQRLYCAQAAAEQKTKRGLLDAIELVDSLPKSHPLRPMVDRYIRRWSLDLIDVAEELFQDGKLAEALEAVNRIPKDRLPCTENECPAKSLARRVKSWQDIWTKAEKTFKDAEKALIDQEWNKSAEIATLLLSVDNRYWRTLKYEEISQQIAEVKGNNSQLAKARDLAQRGEVGDLVEAIRLASSVTSHSRLYPVAQGAIAKFSRQLIDLADAALKSKDLNEALAIVDKIPARAKLSDDVRDFKLLARAEAKTWSGRIPDIQGAMVDARSLQPARPLYSRAQKLLAQWQTAIEDIARLERARQMASGGKLPDLMSAIAEVSLIPKSNPRWQEAQQLITDWRVTIETQEDRPFLDRADQFAQGGTIANYQAAINEISRIREGRALSKEAKERFTDWQGKLEIMEDQPVLAQARSMAMMGNLRDAIAMAGRIGNGRMLHGEAQADISSWQQQVESEDSLGRARRIAQSGDADSLRRAIDSASRIASNSALRANAEVEIETWSNRILQIAIDRSNRDLYAAIDIARLVPQGTSAYSTAQSQIASWQAQLQPVAPPSAPDPAPPAPLAPLPAPQPNEVIPPQPPF